jgi:hypothetical protein
VVDVDLVFDLAMHYACQNSSGTANYNDCVAAQGTGSPSIAPSVVGIHFENIRGTAWRSGWFRCLAEAPCREVSFSGIDVVASEGFLCEHAEVSGWDVAEQACGKAAVVAAAAPPPPAAAAAAAQISSGVPTEGLPLPPDTSSPPSPPTAACPCDDPRLCERVGGPLPDKELLVYHIGYVGDDREWLHYDWEHMTTISIVGHDPWMSSPDGYAKLMCHAHKNGVRVTFCTGAKNATFCAIYI